VSLRHGDDELLHHARVFDEGPMKGRIPVLFPAVGRSFEKGKLGCYRHCGTVCPMDIHGFAKDLPWQEVQRHADAAGARITVELASTEQTLKSYPYPFLLSLQYILRQTRLTLTATIHNHSAKAMPFCFGYHPYFRAPIGEGRREDCIIRVPGDAVWEMSAGQPTGRKLPTPPEFAAGTPLPPEHLEKILTDLEPDPDTGWACAEVCYPEAGKTLRVEFDPLGLGTVTVFSPPDSGYVCLEPRTGLPNALSDEAPVTEGVVRIGPGGSFRTTVRIRVSG
jgi:galactose mutarotase-like enzyme